MLAVTQRLRRRGDFTAAVRAGARAGRGALVVHVLTAVAGEPRDDRPVRAGFVVPRAVGGAVVRNKVRRRLRHLVRERLGPLPSGTDVVVRALPAAAARSYGDLERDFAAALHSALAAAGRRRRQASEPAPAGVRFPGAESAGAESAGAEPGGRR